ncbi:MAG: hydrogenase maturation nickel metallochaperone HypA [Lachnospiraceae bacterium]|nr:hydrogenase maturation nickel metallochaperone HypA [Lachnospiraceae bacterium]
MHELGIVTYVARSVERVAEENGIHRVAEVVLEIGEVSGIVADYLIDCWDYFRGRYTALSESSLRCETLKAVTWCDHCKKEYPTVQYGRVCPYCGSERTWLLTGNECNIREIAVWDEEEDDE